MRKTLLLPIAIVLLLSVVVYYVFGIDELLRTPKARPYANVTDFSAEYDAQTEIEQALANYSQTSQRASLITNDATVTRRQVALTFDGLTDRAVVQRILDLLKKHNMKATFFVDGLQTIEDPQAVTNIVKEGHGVENYSFSGTRRLERLAPDKLIADFAKAQKIIKISTGSSPKFLKCNDTTYTDELLRAANACGFDSVVQNNAELNVIDVNTLGSADDMVSKLTPGSIISIKLLPFPETIQYEPEIVDLRPAIDKRPGLKELPKSPDGSKTNIVAAVEQLLISLDKAGYAAVLIENMPKSAPTSATPASTQPQAQANKANNSITSLLAQTLDALVNIFSVKTAYAQQAAPLAEEIKALPTTEQAVVFSFGGLTKENSVHKTLDQLDNMGIKATFFVFEVEMQRYPHLVRKIISRGHELGIAINPKPEDGYAQTQQSILNAKSRLLSGFGVNTHLVKQPWGAITDETKRAVASLDCMLIGQIINIIQTKHKDYTSAEQIIKETFGNYRHSLGRGQIVYFRMDFYTDPNVLSNLIYQVKKQKIDNIAFATPYDNPKINKYNDSYYTVKSIGQILSNDKYLYNYPAPLETIPEQLRDVRPLPALANSSVTTEASKRYVGHRDVDYEDRMVGFSRMNDRRLDKTGVIKTNDNVIFLTFDDWGTDAPINKLLYVFRKHNTKATFFIITRSVLENKNLLRSIAVEGHEIGSHSDQHIPMAIRDPQTGKQQDGLSKQERFKDSAKSYEILRDVTGDIVVNGKPSLVRIFRPPTLAVSSQGMEALFTAGYEYIVNGCASSYDYKAESITELVETIKKEIYTEKGELKKGTILVMHMSDNSVYTAMAIDILLTANAAKADTDPTKFKIGRLSDYLVDGYDQMKPVPRDNKYR